MPAAGIGDGEGDVKVRAMVQGLGFRVQDVGSQVEIVGRLKGGVNHCSLHCRLANFRGLRRREKYLVRKRVFFVCAQYELPGYAFLFSQSQRHISPFSSNHGMSPNDSVNYSG